MTGSDAPSDPQGALGLLTVGLVTDADTQMMLEHSAMLPAMLAVMLLRRDEYATHAEGG